MKTSRTQTALILLLTICLMTAFDFFRREFNEKAEAEAIESNQVTRLKKAYNEQMESIKLVESSIQNLSDEALAILPEWLGTLEGRDRGVPMTKSDVREFCDGIKNRLKTPARCQPYLTRKLGQERDDINRLWQTRKSELQSSQSKYRMLRHELEATIHRLKQLGADTSAKN